MHRQIAARSLLIVCLLAGATGLLVLADVGAQHRTSQSRPISLGTSGGSIDDFDFPFCCGGTLGGLLEDSISGKFYIVSNNHVLARSNRATIGEDAVQPGLIDVGCAQNPSDAVANLADFVPLDFSSTNVADAAIAEIRAGHVDTTGTVLDIGALSSDTVAAFVGQTVKKSGRTTGLTQGQVSSVAVSVSVKYAKKCGSRGGSRAMFVNQFRITPGEFSAGGDSGSLIVENKLSGPRAVGLLFAGSSSSTVANPIAGVLGEFNGGNTETGTTYSLAMPGGPPPPSPPTGIIDGTVTSAEDESPIGGASVEVDTGQSDITASNGSYTITDVSTGVHSVTASASGFDSDSKNATVGQGATTTLNFSLSPTITSASDAIVDCVTYTTAGGKNKDRHLKATIRIVDGSGNAVSGASVTATLTPDTGNAVTSTATTDSAGNADFQISNAANVCWKTDVLDVAAPGLNYDGMEPSNGFAKGSDSTPDADCRSGSDDCGESRFGRLVPAAQEKMRAAIALKHRYEALLFRLSKQVVGVGVSAEDGKPVIEIYLRSGTPRAFKRMPSHVENVRVRPVVTGEFVAGQECRAVQ